MKLAYYNKCYNKLPTTRDPQSGHESVWPMVPRYSMPPDLFPMHLSCEANVRTQSETHCI